MLHLSGDTLFKLLLESYVTVRNADLMMSALMSDDKLGFQLLIIHLSSLMRPLLFYFTELFPEVVCFILFKKIERQS